MFYEIGHLVLRPDICDIKFVLGSSRVNLCNIFNLKVMEICSYLPLVLVVLVKLSLCDQVMN